MNVVNRVSYGYPEDHYGAKYGDLYANRDTLMRLTEKIKAPGGSMMMMGTGEGSNEVMVENRIAAEFIRGVFVQNVEQARLLLDALRDKGLVEVKDGKEYVL